MTGVRWASLPSGARRSAIRGQIRGGGATNPHATLLSLSKGYLTKKHSKVTALKGARRVKDIGKRRDIRRCLKNLMRLVPIVSETARPLPPLSRRKGSRGLVEFKVTPHVHIEGDANRYIGLWANHGPPLSWKSARLYAQMMRESMAPPEGKPSTFEIIDMRHRAHHVYDTDDLDDDASDLYAFIEQIENVIEELR